RGHSKRERFSAGSPVRDCFSEAGCGGPPATCACAPAHGSAQSGSSFFWFARAFVSRVGEKKFRSVRRGTPSRLRTTIRQIHGRSRFESSAFAGVKSQGKSGRSNSIAAK